MKNDILTDLITLIKQRNFKNCYYRHTCSLLFKIGKPWSPQLEPRPHLGYYSLQTFFGSLFGNALNLDRRIMEKFLSKYRPPLSKKWNVKKSKWRLSLEKSWKYETGKCNHWSRLDSFNNYYVVNCFSGVSRQ